MPSVFLHTSARRGLRHLPEAARTRVVEVLRKLEDDPRPPGCAKLRAGLGWKIRIGDYRILYTIDDAAGRVDVWYIGPRGGAY